MRIYSEIFVPVCIARDSSNMRLGPPLSKHLYFLLLLANVRACAVNGNNMTGTWPVINGNKINKKRQYLLSIHFLFLRLFVLFLWAFLVSLQTWYPKSSFDKQMLREFWNDKPRYFDMIFTRCCFPDMKFWMSVIV